MHCTLHFLLALVGIFYVPFHAGVDPSKFLVASLEFFVVLTELIEHPYNHYFESMSGSLLASISFSTLSGDSSFLFNWGFFVSPF